MTRRLKYYDFSGNGRYNHTAKQLYYKYNVLRHDNQTVIKPLNNV